MYFENDFNFVGNNQIQKVHPVDTKRLLKITGIRLPSILGLNPYETPFQVWCAMTRMAKIPYVETHEQKVGKFLEPRQREFIKTCYKDINVISPREFYGKNFEAFQYDCHPENNLFGGIWDAKLISKGECVGMLEFKTTHESNKELWEEHPPLYYVVQVLLYACMENKDIADIFVTFLPEKIYQNPTRFQINIENSKFFRYNIRDTFIDLENQTISIRKGQGNFLSLIKQAITWYQTYVLTGVSPACDPTNEKDKQLLHGLMNQKQSMETWKKNFQQFQGK